MKRKKKKRKFLSNDEVANLREGLRKKLEQLKHEYGKQTHQTKPGTIILTKKKENLEKEMTIVEKDLLLLGSKNVIVDLTR